ncbi:MAG: HAD-IA family hydrolase, partial [Burkholderiales bacterium]
PQRCVMIDDTLENLKTAKRLGMQTVWVSTSRKSPAYVNMTLRSVMELPRRLKQLTRDSHGA